MNKRQISKMLFQMLLTADIAGVIESRRFPGLQLDVEALLASKSTPANSTPSFIAWTSSDAALTATG